MLKYWNHRINPSHYLIIYNNSKKKSCNTENTGFWPLNVFLLDSDLLQVWESEKKHVNISNRRLWHDRMLIRKKNAAPFQLLDTCSVNKGKKKKKETRKLSTQLWRVNKKLFPTLNSNYAMSCKSFGIN